MIKDISGFSSGKVSCSMLQRLYIQSLAILRTFARKSSKRSERVKTFLRVRLWESHATNAKIKIKNGVTMLVSEIRCVVHHAKLPNLVIVAVLGFIHFCPLEGRRCDEIQFEWIH